MGFNMKEYYKNYRKTNLTQLSIAIPKETADAIKDELAKDGLSFRKFVLNAINEYLNKKGK